MEKATGQKYRDACDQCHIRKIKCISDQKGACFGCRHNARRCVFSPRDEMGRPKRAAQSKASSNKEVVEAVQIGEERLPSHHEEQSGSSSSGSSSTASAESRSTAASSLDENESLLPGKRTTLHIRDIHVLPPSNPGQAENNTLQLSLPELHR